MAKTRDPAMKEETEKMTSMAKNHNNAAGDVSDAEERDIVAVDSEGPAKAVASPRHPLENSWTFWFDNPAAKSKQVAWGSSIRNIYTFSTAEDFWSGPCNRLSESRDAGNAETRTISPVVNNAASFSMHMNCNWSEGAELVGVFDGERRRLLSSGGSDPCTGRR